MALIYCIQDQETTTNSTVQPTPFRPHKASGSKKRTLEAVDQAEIPNMRPAKVVRLNQKGGSTQQPEKEDHAIQQAFVGRYPNSAFVSTLWRLLASLVHAIYTVN